MNASTEVFLDDFGLSTTTSGKNIFICEYSNETSLPLKIFAQKVPPLFKTCVVIFNAESKSCA